MTRFGTWISRKDLPIRRVAQERCPYCGNPTLDFFMDKKGDASFRCPSCGWPATSPKLNERKPNSHGTGKKITIKLTPVKMTTQGRLWTAEMTPPHDEGHPRHSFGPMTVGDLVAALSAAGCSRADINKALYEAWILNRNRFKEEEAKE